MRVQLMAIGAAVITVAFAGCIQPASSSNKDSDWAAIVSLEDQAKAIANTSGCASSAQCRSAPVGNRACGGPRYYIAYCAATTDSAALFNKLKQVSAAEDAYNKKYNLVSTCEFRMPPDVALANGVCTAR